MKKILILLFVDLLPFILLAQTNKTSEPELPGPKEVLTILENSQKIYTIDMINDTAGFKFPEYQQIGDQYYLEKKDSSTLLKQYMLSKAGKFNFEKAEKHYTAKEYDSAKFYYKETMKTDSSYSKPYIYIGDIYYLNNNYDSALVYYKKGVDVNAIDYDAHWFLADAYNKKKDYDLELKELIIAHLLNRNHKELFERLKIGFKHAGKRWDDWGITPIFDITARGDSGAYIKMSEEWVGYACAEALWRYEPGFSEKYQGVKYKDQPISYKKEVSCLYANQNSKSKDMEKLWKIAKDGYFEEAVWYEILSKEVPLSVLVMSHDMINRLVEYINKYHLSL